MVLERPVTMLQGRVIRARIKDTDVRISNLLVWISPRRKARTRSTRGQLYALTPSIPKRDGIVSVKGLAFLFCHPVQTLF